MKNSYRIGIDLGGTNIAAGIVDKEYNIIKKGSVPTRAQRHPDMIIEDMAILCKKLLSECKLTLSDIDSVGIASPGSVMPDKGMIAYANNINMRNYPIAEKLRSYLKVKKIFVENDANAAAMGEAIAGSGKGVESFVMVTLGTGVGGGVVLNGKIYSGPNYAGGELGHMVIEHNGHSCTCGRRGCWETYSSASALIRMTKERMLSDKSSIMWKLTDNDIENVSGKTAFQAARQGDKAAREVCAEYVDYLACGLTNLVNIFQPNVISIGGGISKEGDTLLDPVREIVKRDQYKHSSPIVTELKTAVLGNDAGIVGAAALG